LLREVLRPELERVELPRFEERDLLEFVATIGLLPAAAEAAAAA